MMNLTTNNKTLLSFIATLLIATQAQAGPLLEHADFVKLNPSEQSQYLKDIKRILVGSAKQSEFFVYIMQTLIPESESASLEVNSQNYEYTIQALLKGLPYEKSESNKFNTVALAKIYLWHAKKSFPNSNFEKIEKEVAEAFNPIAAQNLAKAEQLEQAYLQQGDATITLAKHLWFEYKKKWDIQPGKNQIIVTPQMLSPLGAAIKPEDNDSTRTLSFSSGRCLYGGFVIEGEKCSPISKTPEFMKPLVPSELNDFSCATPSTVLCNPLIFGCKMEKGLVPTPICVPPSGNATKMCEARSDAMATVCAIGIIKENPKAWDATNKKLGDFCLPENITKNGFLYFKLQGGAKRSESSRKYAEKDIKETCETTLRLLNDLKDVIRRKASVENQRSAK